MVFNIINEIYNLSTVDSIFFFILNKYLIDISIINSNNTIELAIIIGDSVSKMPYAKKNKQVSICNSKKYNERSSAFFVFNVR